MSKADWIIPAVAALAVGALVYESTRTRAETSTVSQVPSVLPDSVASAPTNAKAVSQLADLEAHMRALADSQEKKDAELTKQIYASRSQSLEYANEIASLRQQLSKQYSSELETQAHAREQQAVQAQARAQALEASREQERRTRARAAAVALVAHEVKSAIAALVVPTTSQTTTLSVYGESSGSYNGSAARARIVAEGNARIPEYTAQFLALFEANKPVVFVDHVEYPSYADYHAQAL